MDGWEEGVVRCREWIHTPLCIVQRPILNANRLELTYETLIACSMRADSLFLSFQIMTAKKRTERRSRLPPDTKKWLQRRKEQKSDHHNVFLSYKTIYHLVVRTGRQRWELG